MHPIFKSKTLKAAPFFQGNEKRRRGVDTYHIHKKHAITILGVEYRSIRDVYVSLGMEYANRFWAAKRLGITQKELVIRELEPIALIRAKSKLALDKLLYGAAPAAELNHTAPCNIIGDTGL